MTVLKGGDTILISDHLYQQCCRGTWHDHPHVQAGEGWVVITATNGTYRYQLLHMYDEHSWLARRH